MFGDDRGDVPRAGRDGRTGGHALAPLGRRPSRQCVLCGRRRELDLGPRAHHRLSGRIGEGDDSRGLGLLPRGTSHLAGLGGDGTARKGAASPVPKVPHAVAKRSMEAGRRRPAMLHGRECGLRGDAGRDRLPSQTWGSGTAEIPDVP